MKFAMNKRAAYAMFAGISWVFNTHSFSGSVDGNVAIQDLTPKSGKADTCHQCKPCGAEGSDFQFKRNEHER